MESITDALGRVEDETNPLGTFTHWQQERSGLDNRKWHFGYDNADQLTSATLKNPQQAILQSLAWQYDPAGNRIAEEKDTGGLIPARHNDLNQLTEHGGGPVRFAGTLDEPGKVWIAGHEARMRHMTDFEAWLELSSGTHQIDITAEDYSENSITQTFEVHIADEGQVFLTYDLNGNLLSRVSDTTTTSYEWDAANRLIAIEIEGETRSEFLYDGLSRRVGITEKEWDTNTSSFILQNSSFYLWDGLTIAEQRSGSNGATVEKRFFPQGVEIVTGANPGIYTYRTDHLGSIREVVDDQGDLTARFDYSPWGELETVSGSFDLDFGFTGHFIHQPTGLYLAPFRAYDAGLGRWLSRDPLGFVDGPNLYAYVLNNPINFFDPLGLCKESRWKNAWNKFKETSSGEFGIGLGLGLDAKIGKLRGQVGVEASLSGGSNLMGKYKTTSQGNAGASLRYGDHAVGANYGGSAYLGGSNGGGSSSNSVFGYKNEPSGFKTSNTSIGVGATVGLVRAGVSADPYAVIRELFRDPNSDCDR